MPEESKDQTENSSPIRRTESHDAPGQREFIRLVQDCERSLFRYILPMVVKHADALDVLQETIVQLWAKFDLYDRDQPFEPWARKFAYMQVLRFREERKRKQSKLVRLSDALIEKLSAESDLQAEVQKLRERALAKCMNKLPPSDTRLLETRYWGSGSVRDVAKTDDVEEHKLYRQLHRIRLILRKCIESTIATWEA